MEQAKKIQSGQTQTSSNDQQMVYISDPGVLKSYPKTITTDEITYDSHVNVRGRKPEDFFLNIEPNVAIRKAWDTVQPYMQHGQEAMKLLAVRPDVALGVSKEISPEQLSMVYKPWGDIIRETYPATGEHNDKNILKGNYMPWFLSEFVPNELLEFGTKPINWATYYGAGKVFDAVAKFGPPLINKAVSALPEKMRSIFLKDIFKSEVGLAKDFETLGISPNTKTSDIVKAWKAKALETHPDRGGNVEDFISARKSYENIMGSRQAVLNKLLDKLRKSGSQEQMKDLSPRLVKLNSANSGQVPIPFNEGDIVKMGSDVVKVAKVSGEIATVNLAGKMVDVSISKLKPFEQEPEENIIVGNPSSKLDDSNSNNPPVKPPIPSEPLPPEDNPKHEAAVNLERLQVSEDSKNLLEKATKTASKEIENQTGKVLSHQEIIDKAKESEILTKGVSRESTLNFEAALLKTRQHLAALSQQPELTPEFLDTLKVVANTGTDIARQLGSFRIDAMPEYATTKAKIISEIQKSGKSNQEILDAAKGVDFRDEKQTVEFYRKFIKPKISDIANEIAYMNILSSPLTHIVNTFSNVIQLAGLNPLTKLASGGVDSIASALTGEDRKHYISDVPRFYKGAINAVPEAITAVSNVLSGKSFIERPDVKHIPTLSPVADYATLGVGKYVIRALEASDVFFRTLIKNGEVEALSGRYSATPDSKQMAIINSEAERRAEYYVFRTNTDQTNKSGQGDFLSNMDKMTNAMYELRSVPGVRWFMRFIRTPTNILKQGIEYSPLGIATLKGSSDKSEQIGKTIIGSIVFAGGSYLAMSGNTTWSLPKGEKDRKLFYQSGRIPYSVRIGDEWVSYSKIGTLAYPLAMAAALHYYQNDSPSSSTDTSAEKGLQAIQGIMGFFGDQSYVQNLSELTKTIQGDKTAISRIISGVPSQLIPLVSLQRWVNNIIDPIYRKPEKGISVNSIIDNLKTGIIGLSKTLPQQKDMYGRPSEKKNNVINAFSPMRTSPINESGEIMYKATQEKKKIINKQNKKINDIKKSMK